MYLYRSLLFGLYIISYNFYTVYDPKDDDDQNKRTAAQMSASVYMRTLDCSGR